MVDEKAIVLDIFHQMDEPTKQKMAKYVAGDLICLHHTFGRDIRNHYKLWESGWVQELVDGVDMSDDHPDAVSHRITKKVWERCIVWSELYKDNNN